jgi:hypothetical protein
MSRYFLRRGRESLLHGVEAAAMVLAVDKGVLQADVHKSRREQEFYTLDLIREVLAHVAQPAALADVLLAAFGRMVAFDAALGIKDRHAQNWGLIEDIATGTRRFAPLFDTARGLFVWMDDGKLSEECAKDRDGFIRKYAERSRPLIGTGTKGPCNHFDLFACLLNTYPAHVAHEARRVVASLVPDRVVGLLRREFGGLLSPLRLELICDLLEYRRRVLLTIGDGVDWRQRWGVFA